MKWFQTVDRLRESILYLHVADPTRSIAGFEILNLGPIIIEDWRRKVECSGSSSTLIPAQDHVCARGAEFGGMVRMGRERMEIRD